jgi:KUP system potassium uptake protein
LEQVPEGAWFTLLLAVILSCIFVLWRYGKEKQWEAEDSGRCDLLQIITKGKNGKRQLTSKLGGRDLTEMKGTFIFFDKAGTRVPTVYEEFVRKFEAQPAIQVFLHLRGLAIPHVSQNLEASLLVG